MKILLPIAIMIAIAFVPLAAAEPGDKCRGVVDVGCTYQGCYTRYELNPSTPLKDV